MDIFNISDTSESSKEDARKKKTMPRCVDDIADTLDFLEDENYSQTLFLSDVSSFDVQGSGISDVQRVHDHLRLLICQVK